MATMANGRVSPEYIALIFHMQMPMLEVCKIMSIAVNLEHSGSVGRVLDWGSNGY